MRPSTRLVLAMTILGLSPALVFANEPRQHDGGFFLRLSPGFGVMNTKASDGTDEIKIGGPAGVFDLALGAGIGKNLVLHANVEAFSAVEPKVKVNGVELGDLEDVTTSLTMVGAGITYYLGQSNVFISGTVGIAQLTAEYENESSTSDSGLGIEAAVGKEWWVGNRWGLGLAAVVNYHSVPDSDIDENWKGTSFGIRFTATMN